VVFMAHNAREKMEKLEPLDLAKCKTVGDILSGMKKCSFGARMLGEVAEKVVKWTNENPKPIIIFDGRMDTPLGGLLKWMANGKGGKNWFSKIIRPERYKGFNHSGGRALVIGNYPERHEDAIYHKPDESIFINPFGLAKPGQIRDGYFPDAVFSDPRFVIPVLASVLMEKKEGMPETATELIWELKNGGGLADEVNYGFRTLVEMIKDTQCAVFLTASGAMTIAQFNLVICDLIDSGFVQGMATTGALICHGLVENVGLPHYKYNPKFSDAMLAKERLNRVTDTLEPEENLDQVEFLLEEVIDNYIGSKPIGSYEFNRLIGSHLVANFPDNRGILKSAFEMDIPVFIPAFYDAESGNDVVIINRKRENNLFPPVIIDQCRDSEKLVEFVTQQKRIGIFTIGGGTPRNYIQNVAPLIEIMNERLGLKMPDVKFSFGCRICPDPMWHGHLSGCTYDEGVSWRKFHANAMKSEIHSDATIILPFMVKALMEQFS
jgi:deoxyhypusine synthase